MIFDLTRQIGSSVSVFYFSILFGYFFSPFQILYILPCHNHDTSRKNHPHRQMNPEEEKYKADQRSVSDAIPETFKI